MKRPSGGENKSKRLKKSQPGEEDIKIESLEDAIHVLISGKSSLSKLQLDHVFQVIENAAYTEGLDTQDISVLFEYLASHTMGENIRHRLIFCLIPKTCIPEEVYIRSVCLLTDFSLNLHTKEKLLKWMIAMYELLDSSEEFSCLYQILFVLLDTHSLRPYLCHLLLLMTTKEFVSTSRIRYLVELLCKLGPERPVLALLCHYAKFKPDLVLVQCKHKSFFKSLGKLPSLVNQVHLNRKPKTLETFVPVKERVNQFTSISDSLNLLEEMKGVHNLFKDDKRRVLLISNISEKVLLCFRLYIRSMLCAGNSISSRKVKYSKEEMLSIVSDVTFELQESIPEVSYFIQNFIQLWDGHTYKDVLFQLIPHWQLCSFDSLQDAILHPLFQYFCSASVQSKCDIIKCLSKLYHNWVLLELLRQSKQGKIFRRVFQQDDLIDAENEVKELGNYVEKLCILALQLHPDHPPFLLHNVLYHYQMVAVVHSRRNLCLPLLPRALSSAAMFSTSILTFSQLCTIIRSYREHYLHMKKEKSFVGNLYRNHLNYNIVDVCNTLWRCQAFQPGPKTLIFNYTFPSYCKGDIFNICKHPAFVWSCYNFINKSSMQLDLDSFFKKTETRDMYMKFLDGFGLTDIVKFLTLFIKIKT